jgi:hypothetical protein
MRDFVIEFIFGIRMFSIFMGISFVKWFRRF